MRNRDRVAGKTNWVYLSLKSGVLERVAVGAICPTLGTMQPYSSQGRASGNDNFQISCLPIPCRRPKRKDRNS